MRKILRIGDERGSAKTQGNREGKETLTSGATVSPETA